MGIIPRHYDDSVIGDSKIIHKYPLSVEGSILTVRALCRALISLTPLRPRGYWGLKDIQVTERNYPTRQHSGARHGK